MSSITEPPALAGPRKCGVSPVSGRITIGNDIMPCQYCEFCGALAINRILSDLHEAGQAIDTRCRCVRCLADIVNKSDVDRE